MDHVAATGDTALPILHKMLIFILDSKPHDRNNCLMDTDVPVTIDFIRILDIEATPIECSVQGIIYGMVAQFHSLNMHNCIHNRTYMYIFY